MPSPAQPIERKLAAIFAADVAGYSREGPKRSDFVLKRPRRGQRRPVNPQAASVSARDELLVAADELRHAWRRLGATNPDIVDPFQHGHVSDSRLCKHVPVKARQGVGPDTVLKHASAANPAVDDTHPDSGRR